MTTKPTARKSAAMPHETTASASKAADGSSAPQQEEKRVQGRTAGIEAQADSYDRWFCARVLASMADPRPSVPHHEAMARVDAIIDAAERQAGMTVC